MILTKTVATVPSDPNFTLPSAELLQTRASFPPCLEMLMIKDLPHPASLSSEC